MGIWYHGTSIENALRIAEIGAILSPLDQEILYFDNILKNNPKVSEFWERKIPSQTQEEYILERLANQYGAHEIEHRVKSVSLSDLRLASFYASRFEYRDGGIILGFNLLKESKRISNILFIPRKVTLDRQLQSVSFSPKAEQYRQGIEEAFRTYAPIIRAIPE